MDVLVLIDKLDDLVHNAKAVPLTDQVRIDREEIYDILDQMRAELRPEVFEEVYSPPVSSGSGAGSVKVREAAVAMAEAAWRQAARAVNKSCRGLAKEDFVRMRPTTRYARRP